MELGSTDRRTKKLIEAKSISKSFGGVALFKNLNMILGPNTRLGLVGRNGCGKSTLIRCLLEQEKVDSGEVRHADDLKIAYFEQNRESLDQNVSVHKAICPEGDYVHPMGKPVHVRSYLSRFLFSSEQMGLPVERLSGGEQSRLLLARLMLRPADILILDEPTNDLDLATLDVLEDVLKDFTGAVVLVSHDRYFVDHVCNQIWAFPPAAANGQPMGPIVHVADMEQWERWYTDLLERRFDPPVVESSQTATEATPKKKGRLSYKDQIEYNQMEEKIAALEEKVSKLTREMQEPENVSNSLRLRELSEELGRAQEEVDRLYKRWAELEKQLQG